MPYRRLPNTDQARVRALKAAVEKGDVYNVRDLAISLKTLFEARNFLLKFEAAQIYYTQCYDNQSRASRKHQANVRMARLYISHFIQVLNLAVLRDEIKPVHKELYDLYQKRYGAAIEIQGKESIYEKQLIQRKLNPDDIDWDN